MRCLFCMHTYLTLMSYLIITWVKWMRILVDYSCWKVQSVKPSHANRIIYLISIIQTHSRLISSRLLRSIASGLIAFAAQAHACLLSTIMTDSLSAVARGAPDGLRAPSLAGGGGGGRKSSLDRGRGRSGISLEASQSQGALQPPEAVATRRCSSRDNSLPLMRTKSKALAHARSHLFWKFATYKIHEQQIREPKVPEQPVCTRNVYVWHRVRMPEVL